MLFVETLALLSGAGYFVFAIVTDQARLLSTLGAQPRWLTSDLLAGGALRKSGVRLLVLPEVSALSDAEAAEIRAFTARGGI